jgi:GT2 family glycosyltransferase
MAASEIDRALTSVVVVTADSGPLLHACIASVFASDCPVEIVVVDNASSDGEVERAEVSQAGHARFRVVRNGANLGFGAACNRGAAIARGDLLIFLNPDCELPPDAIAKLRAVFATEPDVGLAGVAFRTAAGSFARGTRRRDPTLRRALCSLTGLARLERLSPALAGVEMPPPSGASAGVERIDAVSGACMAVPRKVFERVGGFDEGYFLHVEDLDLCRRVRDAGYAVALVHSITGRHLQGSSSRHRPYFVARHKREGMWRYFLKFDPAARNPLARAGVRLGVWAHWAASIAKQALARVLGPGA